MDRITTVSDTTVSNTTRAHPSVGHAAGVCWCGQDIDNVRGRYCPRCGTARAPHVAEALSRLAA